MPDLSGTNYNESDSLNNNPAPNGMPEGMAPSGVNDAWRAGIGATKRFWDRANATVTTSGSAGAYVYTPADTSFPTAYVQGEVFAFTANFASVGNDTLNVNAIGAKPLYKEGASGLVKIASGDVVANQMVVAAVDNTLNSNAGGFQVLSQVGVGGLQAQINAVLPSGMVVPYAAATAPTGWLIADGSAVSRTTYATLFAVIGTVFGTGDGSTTFNLPDLRGRFVAGVDSGAGRLGSGQAGGVTGVASLGATGGSQSHTLATAELPAHNHGVSDPGHAHGTSDPGHTHVVADAGHAHNIHPTAQGGFAQSTNLFSSNTAGTGPTTTDVAGTGIGIDAATTGLSISGAFTGVTTTNTGSGTALNTTPPVLVLTYIVKT